MQFWVVLSKFTVSQVCLKVFQCNFLLNSGLKSGYCIQFHTYSQWLATNFIISKISIAGKCIKMLKIGWFIQNYCISGMYSNAIFCSTVVKVRLLWPVSHIFTVVCCKFYFFKNFNIWKMHKMLKIA